LTIFSVTSLATTLSVMRAPNSAVMSGMAALAASEA